MVDQPGVHHALDEIGPGEVVIRGRWVRSWLRVDAQAVTTAGAPATIPS